MAKGKEMAMGKEMGMGKEMATVPNAEMAPGNIISLAKGTSSFDHIADGFCVSELRISLIARRKRLVAGSEPVIAYAIYFNRL